MKILVIEDDEEIRNLIKHFLNREKFNVIDTENGMTGLKIAREQKPDLIILDIMLPGLDGINVCSMIRGMPEKYGDPLIIMTTAKTETEDVLTGLGTGADDYLKKPFDPRELIMRVKALLKRENKEFIKTYTFADIVIDDEKHLVTQKENEIELSKKEYDLLLYFVKNKGMTLTREKILNHVWESNYYSGDRTVDVYIGKLREKFVTFEECMKTLKGVGYKLDEKRSANFLLQKRLEISE